MEHLRVSDRWRPQTAAEERDGQFSPDGKWVAYQSDEAGEPAIYVQPFQRSGNKVRISPGGGVQVRWRADGKELFYLTLDGELMSVPIRVDPSGKTIEASRPIALFKTRMAGGVVLAIARQQYTPSPDGQRFLMPTVAGASTTPPITVILNRKSGRATSEN